jgi:fructose-1,6-bisphosphatase
MQCDVMWCEAHPPRLADMLQPGRNLLIAGYVLYSSATAMVISRTVDTGVHMFTLDHTLGEYVMTRVCPRLLHPGEACMMCVAELDDPRQAQDHLLD